MSILRQGTRHDGCHVPVINGCRLGSAVWPPDHTMGAYRIRPPEQGVRREHPRPDDGRLEPGGHDESLDIGVELCHRIWLLEERVRDLVR